MSAVFDLDSCEAVMFGVNTVLLCIVTITANLPFHWKRHEIKEEILQLVHLFTFF